MAKVIVGMTIWLDSFVADQNGNAGRFYPDLAALRHTTYMKDAIEQTGAFLMGRKTFEMGDLDSYVGDHEFPMPIFVLTRDPPSVAPNQDERLTFGFVTVGVESALPQAKAVARDKAVQVVGGVSTGQQLFDAGPVDELRVDIMPVFLGAGVRSFESSSLEPVRLEKITGQEAGARTSLRFRIKQWLLRSDAQAGNGCAGRRLRAGDEKIVIRSGESAFSSLCLCVKSVFSFSFQLFNSAFCADFKECKCSAGREGNRAT